MKNLIKGKITGSSPDKSSTIKIMGLQLQPSICDSPHKLALKIIFIFLSLSLLYKIEKLSKYLFTKKEKSLMQNTHNFALNIHFTKHSILYTSLVHPRPHILTKLLLLSLTQLKKNFSCTHSRMLY